MTIPLSRGWATLTRYPVLAGIPVLWELITFWLALSLGDTPYLASEASGVHTVSVKFLLPSALPSGADLIGGAPRVAVDSLPITAILPMLLSTIAGAYVMAGYLHLLSGGLRGDAPSSHRFIEGATRYGPRLVLWNGLALVALLLVGTLASGSPELAFVTFGGLMLLALLYFLVPFLIVLHDLPLPEALAGAPTALRTHLSGLLPVGLASVALSIVCSFALTATGLSTLLLASPLWAWLGTWVTLSVFAVLQPQDQPL